MNVLIVSGIWPPDVGGPASHAPELATFLTGRGHGVVVVVTADGQPAVETYPVHAVSRRIPVGIRHAAVAGEVARRARGADVVYATSMLGRSALGATAARRPIVVKLVADEAYERARRRGLFTGGLDEFQRHEGDARIRALRKARDLALSRARHVVCPSGFLAALAVEWGVPHDRVTVLPNPGPDVRAVPTREEARMRLGLDGEVLVFAGRLTKQKAFGDALDAVGRCPGVTMVVAGDGPAQPELEERSRALGLTDRVRFVGPLDRAQVLELFRAADASILSSAWENFPHTVVEALSVGTPVISTAVGGVAEVVDDGRNGLLVPVGDPEALADAITRFFGDPDLRERLSSAAVPSVEHLGFERVYERLLAILESAAA